MDWNEFRSRFPAVGTCVYLNTAGGGALSVNAAAAGMQYYEEHRDLGDAAWGSWLDRVGDVRSSTADRFGAAPEDVSFLQNASLGVNVVARSWPAGARVVALDKEFPSCTTPFMRAGHTMRFLATPDDGSLTAEVLDAFLSHDDDVFIVSSVQYANGFRVDVPSLSAVCRAKGVAFVVDATQSVGAFPVHMTDDGPDYLVFSGYKWATAGYGIAVLITSATAPRREELPPLPGWRSAHRAYDLENNVMDFHEAGVGHEMGHPLFPGIFTLGAALDGLWDVGVGAIADRIRGLTERLLEGVATHRIPVRTAIHPSHQSGIILLDMPNADTVARALAETGTYVSPRSGGLRVSMHGYNNAADVDAFVSDLGRIGAFTER